MFSLRLRLAPRFCFALLFTLLTLSFAGHAHAYAWMIRHESSRCASCHLDPSGAGLLTDYGRDQSDEVLRMRYGSPASETSSTSGFAWGLLKEPSWLTLGGQFRPMFMELKVGSAPFASDTVLMQADLQGEVSVGHFRANLSLGAAPTNGSGASIAGSFISREHWLGYGISDDRFLLRVGRVNLPFGVRSIEHTLWVRRATRTDLNDTQQHGVALAFDGSGIRAEVMAIAGNYQIRPDAYRERGYSLSAEYAAADRLALGVSSLATHAARDLLLKTPNTRQAHGLFVRYAPWEPLVLLGEGDVLLQHTPGSATLVGLASMLQADVEPVQGLHFMLTGETYTPGKQAQSYGGWLGSSWFFAPHADVRVDFMRRSEIFGPMRVHVTAAMAQLHVYL
ncbi:MAG TPA: hypothetical protein VNG33_17150 [Polyangiaceae bacterium]|nr:hypothetical protein [Polyangiaceae bacterium]